MVGGCTHTRSLVCALVPHLLLTLLMVAGSLASSSSSLEEVPLCDVDAAVVQCGLQARTNCAIHRCIADACPLFEPARIAADTRCSSTTARNKVGVRASPPRRRSAAIEAAGIPKPSTGPQAASFVTVASPCDPTETNATTQSLAWIRLQLFSTAFDMYHNGAQEHYSENMTLRWTGIHDHVCPPRVPTYSDCSSAVTWMYWTLFGLGPDFLNGEAWQAGYTGSLKIHGQAVPSNSSLDLRIGDLCFYYHPMHHVAMYVGDGHVVSHGMDPVGYYPWNYAPVDYCRRYL